MENNAHEVEKKIFKEWKDGDYFSRSKGKGEFANKSFTITIPPPNITGVLHMGHALNDSIQDCLIRRARMQGYKTRWVLGTDHAGIATQTKVDKHLAEQGINRREIGREAFIEECQKWRKEYGTTIVNQIQEMGCSCDYMDEKFTMSEDFSNAVKELFVKWYNDGIIYRGKRIVNWCPSCTTAIADDEAEYEEEHGHLWYIRYPLESKVGDVEYIVVATTRPETMLGDTGVAISPQDDRYKALIGSNVILPLVGRKIPIFDDFYVDSEFGTGAVKITPAHDPNDFAIGSRHNLEKINVFDENAHVVEGYGKYSGMDRNEARREIVADLEELGLLDHIEDLDHSVMHCYRCHTTLEPWLSEQWFVDVSKIKEPAKRAVENGEIKFYPERWKQVYLDWLENLQDWCISRQLWWGHRIPMFYCDACKEQFASVEELDNCPTCGGALRQDEDVLDTWFSSQLWPFATLGWGSDDTSELDNYYPTQVLSTARDIMGLWVARMVMSSMYCTKEIPFKDVIIHPTIMGSDGKPMSKSRGNGVNPIDLMNKYSADAMRFGLLSQVTGSQAVNFEERKIENARNFANKIRNAYKFVSMNEKDFDVTEPCPVSLADKWIFSELYELIVNIDNAYSKYDFNQIATLLYHFFWNEFCDWYIELSKPRLNQDSNCEDRNICLNNLRFVLEVALKLLHPIMPHLTEEIYDDIHIKDSNDKLIVANWPKSQDFKKYLDEDVSAKMNIMIDIIGGLRSLRARYNLGNKEKLNIIISCNKDIKELIESDINTLFKLGNINEIKFDDQFQGNSGYSAFSTSDAEVFVSLDGIVDIEKERNRLSKLINQTEKDMMRLDKKLNNEGFLKKADPSIIEKDRNKYNELRDLYEKTKVQLEQL